MAALTVTEFSLRTIMPAEDVLRLQSQYPGFLDAQISIAQNWVEARLRKRYAIPFIAPYPETFLSWIVSLVTLAAYYRRGFNPAGAENEQIIKDADTARAEVKEASDSKDGLFDLPLRQDTGASGVSAGSPFWYSETSPWRWTEIQLEETEDRG